MAIPNERIVPLSADHLSMCRFSSPTSQKYALVEKAILGMAYLHGPRSKQTLGEPFGKSEPLQTRD